MQITLPENASEASLRRAEIAGRLAEACPPGLADEIALVGSTAHGFADDSSDVELNLWSNAIPMRAARVAWLNAAGASDIHVEDAPRPDNSYWISFRIREIRGEVGWQTYAALRDRIALIRAGTSDRKVLVFAEIVGSAIPLRTSGVIPNWQAALAEYSDAVQERLIALAVGRWSQPGHVAGTRRLAQRGERLALMERLLGDLEAALRVVYAAHRRWEPSAKWTLTVAREFAPIDLIPRIDAVLDDKLLERRVELCVMLCLDVLALLPEGYDVSAAVAGLRAASG